MAEVAIAIAAIIAAVILNHYAMPLASLKRWSPFRIDALGIVTMLGTAEVDRAVGRLVPSRWAEWLPLLGAFTVATNQITEPIPGFVLHNISDGILATDLAGWFSRWLLCQELTDHSTTITISDRKQRRPLRAQLGAIILAVITLGFLTIVSASIGDWWGFANSVSMVFSVAVRNTVLAQNRIAIDKAVEKAGQPASEPLKVFLTMPNGKAVSISTSRGIVINCLLTTPKPVRPRVYQRARALGWFMFGIHVVSLGMSALFIQLLSVCLLLSATVVVVRQIGDDDSCIASRLLLEQSNARGKEFRAKTYAKFRLTEAEENTMVNWNLFPQKSNGPWWNSWRECVRDGNLERFERWDEILARAYRNPQPPPAEEDAIGPVPPAATHHRS